MTIHEPNQFCISERKLFWIIDQHKRHSIWKQPYREMFSLLRLQFNSNLHYDKRDDFNSPIMNLPFTYVYVATFQQHQHVEYIYFSIDFFDRWLLLTRKLLKQGFLLVKLKSSLRNFYGRHHDMVNHYGISVSQMTTDMFRFS